MHRAKKKSLGFIYNIISFMYIQKFRIGLSNGISRHSNSNFKKAKHSRKKRYNNSEEASFKKLVKLKFSLTPISTV